jgi:UDP-N-acetyl-2-amino-2-deoxyglucuronate dehydrogenase
MKRNGMVVGIVGTGMIASFHARAIKAMAGARLGGVCGTSPEKAERFAAEHETRAFPSLEALLADPAIELVTIATPSGAHLEPALAALAAGKHLAIEKPLEVTTARIDTLLEAAASRGLTVAPILNRRFHPAMEAFTAAVRAGRFGRLTSASAYIKWYRDQAYYDSAPWRGTWALDGGGALMNQSIHTLDALLHLAGPVATVRASTACLAHERIEVEDIGIALLEFANGARGVIEGMTCAWSEKGHPARLQLAGTDGSVFLADEAFEVWEFRDSDEADAVVRERFMRTTAAGQGANDPKAISFLQHQRNFEAIVEAIRADRPVAPSAAEARRSVALLEAIYRSAAEGGQRVRLEE